MARSTAPFRLHDVEVRPASNEIVVAGIVSRVKPRQMDVLLRLAAAAGEVVPRETLLADVWPRRMVNDDVLSRVIADLRIALHDDAREARFIETIPKVGYRLIAPMTPVKPPATPPGPAKRSPRWRPWHVAVAVVAVIVLTLALVLRPAPPAVAERAQLERQLAQAEPFSSDVALEVAPRFSPDGRAVAFATGQGRQSQIVVRDVASAQRRMFRRPRRSQPVTGLFSRWPASRVLPPHAGRGLRDIGARPCHARDTAARRLHATTAAAL